MKIRKKPQGAFWMDGEAPQIIVKEFSGSYFVELFLGIENGGLKLFIIDEYKTKAAAIKKAKYYKKILSNLEVVEAI